MREKKDAKKCHKLRYYKPFRYFAEIYFRNILPKILKSLPDKRKREDREFEKIEYTAYCLRLSWLGCGMNNEPLLRRLLLSGISSLFMATMLCGLLWCMCVCACHFCVGSHRQLCGRCLFDVSFVYQHDVINWRHNSNNCVSNDISSIKIFSTFLEQKHLISIGWKIFR